MNLQTYIKYRRVFEFLLWLLFIIGTLAANILVTAIDIERSGNPFPLRDHIIWEASSVFVIFLLVPFVLLCDARVPLRWASFPGSFLQHLLFSGVFCLVHVAAMIGIRKLTYMVAGTSYDFGNIPLGFVYEYLKDGRTYFLLLALIYLYRFMLLRLQGEASVLGSDEGQVEHEDRSSKVERLLIKKLGKEFLIHTKDIDYIEAAGNYVNLHIGERIYPLRSTMTKIAKLLGSTTFRRVHRSYMVNINRVSEIQPLESGDATIKLMSNVEVPMSRTYRAELMS